MTSEELRETFDHFDTDGNGRIDCAEFTRLMRALDAEMSADELNIGFSAIDTNGNGSIDFDEFACWWADRC